MATDRLHVEVVYALPEKQRLIALDVPCLLYTSPSPRD